MPRTFTRRDVLKATAALAAAPAFPALSASGDYDVAIIGAGAAGIAAGRRIAQAGKSYVILEAGNRAGGRIASASLPSGAVYDRGANRFSAPARNPLVAIARAERLKLYEPSPGRPAYVGARGARRRVRRFHRFAAAGEPDDRGRGRTRPRHRGGARCPNSAIGGEPSLSCSAR